MNDPGDEHVDPPPVVLDPIEAFLAELDPPTVPYETMQMIMLAESYRDCCAECAREVNGEDGS